MGPVGERRGVALRRPRSGVIVLAAVVAGLSAATARAGTPDGATSDISGASKGGGGTISDRWTGSACVGCHRPDPTFSHPVGFTPDRPLPAAFPLDHGRFTCETCHDPADPSTHAGIRTESGVSLRGHFVGFGLCAQCHSYSPGSPTSAHASAVDRAHLRWPDDPPDRSTAVSTGFGATLDRESARCLECHDGTLATDVDTKPTGRIGSSLLGQDHPVGVPYVSHQQRSRMERLVHVDSLDRRVRLFDGTVGCGSCHSVYSRLPRRLVMSNLGSALCLSCHEGR